MLCCLPIKNSNDGNTKGPKVLNGCPIEQLIGWTQTFLVNFVGYPAASVPAGLSKSGLPIGMQIIGKRHHDEDVLIASRMFEKIADWRKYYEVPFNRKI